MTSDNYTVTKHSNYLENITSNKITIDGSCKNSCLSLVTTDIKWNTCLTQKYQEIYQQLSLPK